MQSLACTEIALEAGLGGESSGTSSGLFDIIKSWGFTE
jgi:hypothetical protein